MAHHFDAKYWAGPQSRHAMPLHVGGSAPMPSINHDSTLPQWAGNYSSAYGPTGGDASNLMVSAALPLRPRVPSNAPGPVPVEHHLLDKASKNHALVQPQLQMPRVPVPGALRPDSHNRFPGCEGRIGFLPSTWSSLSSSMIAEAPIAEAPITQSSSKAKGQEPDLPREFVHSHFESAPSFPFAQGPSKGKGKGTSHDETGHDARSNAVSNRGQQLEGAGLQTFPSSLQQTHKSGHPGAGSLALPQPPQAAPLVVNGSGALRAKLTSEATAMTFASVNPCQNHNVCAYMTYTGNTHFEDHVFAAILSRFGSLAHFDFRNSRQNVSPDSARNQ